MDGLPCALCVETIPSVVQRETRGQLRNRVPRLVAVA